jgi:hypothetical protein
MAVTLHRSSRSISAAASDRCVAAQLQDADNVVGVVVGVAGAEPPAERVLFVLDRERRREDPVPRRHLTLAVGDDVVGEAEVGGLADLAANPVPGAPIARQRLLPLVEELGELGKVAVVDLEVSGVALDQLTHARLERDLGGERHWATQGLSLVAAVH